MNELRASAYLSARERADSQLPINETRNRYFENTILSVLGSIYQGNLHGVVPLGESGFLVPCTNPDYGFLDPLFPLKAANAFRQGALDAKNSISASVLAVTKQLYLDQFSPEAQGGAEQRWEDPQITFIPMDLGEPDSLLKQFGYPAFDVGNPDWFRPAFNYMKMWADPEVIYYSKWARNDLENYLYHIGYVTDMTPDDVLYQLSKHEGIEKYVVAPLLRKLVPNIDTHTALQEGAADFLGARKLYELKVLVGESEYDNFNLKREEASPAHIERWLRDVGRVNYTMSASIFDAILLTFTDPVSLEVDSNAMFETMISAIQAGVTFESFHDLALELYRQGEQRYLALKGRSWAYSQKSNEAIYTRIADHLNMFTSFLGIGRGDLAYIQRKYMLDSFSAYMKSKGVQLQKTDLINQFIKEDQSWFRTR